jgi:hypothetical protein
MSFAEPTAYYPEPSGKPDVMEPRTVPAGPAVRGLLFRTESMAEQAARGLSGEVVQETRTFWAERTGEYVSEDEAREAIGSIAAFFDLLDGWDRDADGEEERATP